MTSTVDKGNAFRDEVASLLSAAGFLVTKEVRERFKKADARVTFNRIDIDGPTKYLVEAKDYSNALPLGECSQFVHDYGSLVQTGVANRAWLISSGPITPDGRVAIESNHQLRCFTFEELQRSLLGLDGYMREIIWEYNEGRIGEFFVPPKTNDGKNIEDEIERWLVNLGANQMAIIGSYGKGKSTFARHFAAKLAQMALADPRKISRVPILVELGSLADDQSIDGLIGKVLASNYRVANYHFELFSKLNEHGRFLVILDGFDEMKRGMTFHGFERVFRELLKLDRGNAKLLILGRDNAFHTDEEFRTIILGRQMTAGGQGYRSEIGAL